MHSLTDALLKLFRLRSESYVWEIRRVVYLDVTQGARVDTEQTVRVGIMACIGNRNTALEKARRLYPLYRDDLFIRPYTGERDENSS